MDRLLGVAMLGLSAIYLTATWRLPAVVLGDPLGPRAFPLALGLLLIVPAAALAFFGAGSTQTGARAFVPLRQVGAMAGVLAIAAVFYFVFETLGYLLSTPIFLFVLLSVMHGWPFWQNALVAIAFTGATYYMFQFLGVSLPILPSFV